MVKKVAVVAGGYSKEAAISLKSAEQIVASIDKELFDVYTVMITKEKWSVCLENTEIIIDKNDFSFYYKGEKMLFDVVFMAIHGTPGEDGKLQAYFEMIDIPVTTCNSFVSAITFNKYASKLYLKEFSIPTAKSLVFTKNKNTINTEQIARELGFPMFVKPNNGGSSFGASMVKQEVELMQAIEKAFDEDTQIIIEEFIKGREFTCGVFKDSEREYVFPITEIISKNEFFDYQAKYEGLSNEITPANLSQQQFLECQQLSSIIYDLLNCKGIVRIDYLFRDNTFYFMEINTVPGMSAASLIPQQAKVYGLSLSDLYTLLLKNALGG